MFLQKLEKTLVTQKGFFNDENNLNCQLVKQEIWLPNELAIFVNIVHCLFLCVGSPKEDIFPGHILNPIFQSSCTLQ